jgi:hypothetical protein
VNVVALCAYRDSVEKPSGNADETATVLRLAVQLRQAAADLGRADLVARIDEVIGLIGADGDTPEAGKDEKAGAVIKFLDGLGF